MRSVALLAALALVGCDSKPPKEENLLETVQNSAPATQPAAPIPPPNLMPEQRYQALGTEPFWSVFVEDGRLRYTTPENTKGTDFPAKRSEEGQAQVWTGTFEGSSFTLRIAPGTCSDGMSDTVYAYTAMVAFAGQTLQGCARLK